MYQHLAGLVHHAHVHRLGVQIHAAVEWMLLLVESHHDLLKGTKGTWLPRVYRTVCGPVPEEAMMSIQLALETLASPLSIPHGTRNTSAHFCGPHLDLPESAVAYSSEFVN